MEFWLPAIVVLFFSFCVAVSSCGEVEVTCKCVCPAAETSNGP